MNVINILTNIIEKWKIFNKYLNKRTILNPLIFKKTFYKIPV